MSGEELVSHSLDTHIPHTFFSVTNSMFQEKLLVLCPLCLRDTSYIQIAAGRLGRGCSTYALVQVDGVLAGHHVGDSRALSVGLDVGHLCEGY